MAEAVISGPSTTGNVTSSRKKKDVGLNRKRQMHDLGCPIISKKKKKRR